MAVKKPADILKEAETKAKKIIAEAQKEAKEVRDKADNEKKEAYKEIEIFYVTTHDPSEKGYRIHLVVFLNFPNTKCSQKFFINYIFKNFFVRYIPDPYRTDKNLRCLHYFIYRGILIRF